MSVRLPSRKTVAIAVVALLLAYLLFGWLAVPPLVQSQAEKFVAEKTGHRLTMDKPSFNPFNLSMRLANLRLEEPDGKPLLAFKELLVDVSVTSLFRRAYVFDAIRLDGLAATVAELPGERLNWTALIESLKGKEAPAAPAAAPAEGRAAENAPPRSSAVAEMHFTFTTESWVEVRDRNNRILLSQLNPAGTEQRLQGRTPLTLVVGNAHGVRLTYKGAPVDLAPHTRVEVARLTLE